MQEATSARMTVGSPRTVGCCVAVGWADRAVTSALRDQQVRPVRMGVEELLSGSSPVRMSGLVYDFAPWTAEAQRRFRKLVATVPELPILLYLPPTGSAFAALGCLPPAERVRLQVQGRDSESLRCLTDEVRWLLNARPRLQVLASLDFVIDSMESTAFLFAHQVLAMLGAGQRPRVHIVANTLGVSERTVARRLAQNGLPPPKRFLDWLTMFQVVAVAATADISIRRAGRRAGLSSNDLYRIRCRLLGSCPSRSCAVELRDLLLRGLALEVHRLRRVNQDDMRAVGPVGANREPTHPQLTKNPLVSVA